MTIWLSRGAVENGEEMPVGNDRRWRLAPRAASVLKNDKT